MSIFDFIFGSASRKKVSFGNRKKLNRQDVVNLVWSITSLDSEQKEIVKNKLLKQLDDGGVSQWEYREAIRQLSLNRVELGLSAVDIKNLKKIVTH